jgi:hypothetical protein
MRETCHRAVWEDGPVRDAWGMQRWPSRSLWCLHDEAWSSLLTNSSSSCRLDWGPGLNRPSVLGTFRSMQAYCQAGERGKRSLGHACAARGLNALRRLPWTPCMNLGWLVCVSRGGACVRGSGCDRTLVVTHSPRTMRPPGALSFHHEDDMFTWEVCMLSEFCTNGHLLWSYRPPFRFVCDVDRAALASYIGSVRDAPDGSV